MSNLHDGLSTAALEHVAKRVYATPAARRRLIHAVVPPGTWKRRQRSGKLSDVESQRTARLANIIALSDCVWRDTSSARAFLTTPHPELEDMEPILAAVDEFGERHVERILHGILHGIAA